MIETLKLSMVSLVIVLMEGLASQAACAQVDSRQSQDSAQNQGTPFIKKEGSHNGGASNLAAKAIYVINGDRLRNVDILYLKIQRMKSRL